MIQQLKVAWDGYVRPLLRQPKQLQVAALCYKGEASQRKVLLITSRDTGRWIIPKGWPIPGLNSQESAMQEAWEEAGVRKGKLSDAAIGTYTYNKTFEEGPAVPIETLVYPVAVEELADEFPEADERKRKWVTPSDAANMVQEPELQSILRDL
ncbi:MAG: NUDIX hydrolase [Rhodobacteraceae bacterium]|nr:NUDIX hydrolase [Paracoccaceae bacterium]